MSKSEETLSSIMEASYRLFATYGIVKTTYTMIGEEVGIAKPSIYYYFKSKDALIECIFTELCKAMQFSSYFHTEEFTKSNFIEKCIAIGLKIIDEQRNDPYFNRVLQEYVLLSSRNKMYKDRLLTVQTEYLHGFEVLLIKANELQLIENKNLVSKAHMLALVLDNIGNFMMIDAKIDYKQIWIEAVNNIFERRG
ncbi:TPA: TetR/AcrR family transcriptional regulator [Bacillus thuringiensis]|jgi:AcrR family transcriptional regulator|uniref:TetR family transcriptional regulator n=4 Tax=Bacillus cereus group TaxID=86661 RepID=A0A9X6KUC1_BACTU|nr:MULTISPECIES: TetR/AcrR family transcriptional regulator [Bacillus]NIE92536.1 helix-turn-helix transcriptional regulator [Bacillus sp. Ab-1751]AGE78027.1 Transcriptional regulator, TetR [Bacillus thuringiensis serovar kurstaki str. HD73]AHZ51096.1 TetR family transcriptional regulator [Bacillus thuringiensis serovar kurstaki str. YBT-1520]AIE33508.1 TetR family transcriptional regulator [Bacillus thuringiensis serovar kurstaki str. HD-1]AIM32216.1 Transcriptional regulator, TetR [Bacillus t